MKIKSYAKSQEYLHLYPTGSSPEKPYDKSKKT